MTGKSSPDLNDWAALWGDAQKQYFQSWTDLSRQMGGAAFRKEEAPPNPWAQSFDFWAQLMGRSMAPESRDWASKLTELNKGYLRMGENLWKMFSGAPSSNPETWWETVNQGLKQMQEGFAAGTGPGKDPWAGFATFWGLPMDHWRRVYSACSAMPGDMEKALRSFAAAGESPEGALNRWLSTPSLGYTREWQEELQQWQQLWLEHGQAVQGYGKVLAGIATRACERLGQKLRELATQGKTPETLRAFYDLWVDCGEDAYAEAAPTSEFTYAQARLVNTLMAVKRHEQQMVDEVLSGLNMPTRRELDTSHRRVHQLQRQVWRLQESLDDAGVRSLREEVAALQREIAALQGHAEEPAAEKRGPGRGAKPTSKA